MASALGRDTTFIWGPPGTGKTRTIGKIGEQLVRRERSVLVVSHTNSAVDQAILEVVRDLVRRLLAIADWRAQADAEVVGLRADERTLEAARVEAVVVSARSNSGYPSTIFQ